MQTTRWTDLQLLLKEGTLFGTVLVDVARAAQSYDSLIPWIVRNKKPRPTCDDSPLRVREPASHARFSGSNLEKKGKGRKSKHPQQIRPPRKHRPRRRNISRLLADDK
jgi:hypothetical protein